MIINKIEFTQSLMEILLELRSQLALNKIDYLKIQPRESGRNIQIQCPYHGDGQERKPSAGLRKSDGVFHCFACGETHDLPEVISHCFGKNDMGAYGWQWLLKNFLTISIEERKDIVLNFSRGSSASHHISNKHFVSEEELDSYRYCHEYWAKRGITDNNIIELFDLGYDVKNKMITFPVRDIDGNCLFVAKRSVRTKFFHYPEGVQKPLYGLYELHHYMMSDANPLWAHYQFHQGDAKEIIVCESMIDCILLWQYGHYALALNGLGNDLQFKQLRDLPCRKIILATDNDKRGMDARERIKKNVSNKIFTEIIFPSDVKDIGECYPDEIKNILEWERL